MIRRLLIAAALSSVAMPAMAQIAIDPDAQGLAIQAKILAQPDFVKGSLPKYGLSTTAADNSAAMLAMVADATTGSGSTRRSGKIVWPCGTFKFSQNLTIVPKVIMEGQNAGCTTWNFTGTGVFLTFNGDTGLTDPFNRTGWGLKNIDIVGPGGATSTTLVAIGSPDQSNPNSASYFTSQGVSYRNGGVAVTWGSGAWDTFFTNNTFFNNGKHLVYPAGLKNSGEQITFTDNLFADNNRTNGLSCIDINGGATAFEIKGGSLDDCQLTVNDGGANVIVSNVHNEWPAAGSAATAQPAPFYVVNNGRLALNNLDVLVNNFGLADTASGALVKASSGQVSITGLYINQTTGSVLPTLVALSGNASLRESGTKLLLGTGSGPYWQNFATNTGTGTVEVTTPAAAMNVGATSQLDPYGASVANSRTLDPAPNAGTVNMLLNSNNFAGTGWNPYCNAPTLTANTTEVLDPFGGNAATKVVPSSSNAACGTYQSGLTQNGTSLRPLGSAQTPSIFVRLPTGYGTFALTLSVVDGDASKNCVASEFKWTRCSQTSLAKYTGTPSARLIQLYEGTSADTAPANVPFYTYGAQSVPGINAGRYTPTTTAAIMPTNRFVGPADFAGLTNFGSTQNYSQLGANGTLKFFGVAPFLDITSNSNTSCGGTGASAVNATNSRGYVTLGGSASTQCSLTFNGGSYAGTSGDTYVPVCMAQLVGGGSTPSGAASATGVSFTFPASQPAGSRFLYICQ